MRDRIKLLKMPGCTLVLVGLAAVVPGVGSCVSVSTESDSPFLVRELLLVNVSAAWHLVLELGAPDRGDVWLPRIPPSGILRRPFSEILDTTCPVTLRVRAFLYAADTQPGAAQALAPAALRLVASGETEVSPYARGVHDVYVITLRDSTEGQGTIMFQSSRLRWDFFGVCAGAPEILPAPLPAESIRGRALTAAAAPVAGLDVVLSAVIRQPGPWCGLPTFTCSQLSDCGTQVPNPDKQLGSSLAMSTTDADGYFEFLAPPGDYALDIFGDGNQFRPTRIEFEAPQTNLVFLVEPQAASASTQTGGP